MAVTSIGNGTFSDCYYLTSITIPNSVTSIDNYAFWGCNNLKDVYYSGTKEEWKKIDIDDNNSCLKSATIHYNNVQTDKILPPSFKVKGVFGGRDVTFNCPTKGAKIYYTTINTSKIDTSLDKYVTPGTTVRFNAYYGTVYAKAYLNGKWSNVARLILKIPKVNKPAITKLSNGKYKIKTITPSCIVYYTTDGTTPSATNYAGKFWTSHDVKIPAGKTIKAIATRSCFSDSDIYVLKP